MAVWELALLIISFTVLVANTVNVLLTLVIVGKFGKVFNKSAKLMEELMDKSNGAIDEIFEEE